MLSVIGVLCCFLCLAVGVSFAAQPAEFNPEYVRDQKSLHGPWQAAREHGDEAVYRPEVAAKVKPWVPSRQPGRALLRWNRETMAATRFVWARRRFTLTTEQAARDAVLKWGGIRFGATAWINGQKVTEQPCVGPHTALIGRGVLRAGRNELVLKIPGWSGVAKGKHGAPLMPTGGSTQGWGAKSPGILDDIWLDFHDGVYMKHVLAMPDVKRSRVTFRLWPDALETMPNQVELTARVSEEGARRPAGQHMAAVKLTAGKPVEITVPVANAKLWTPQECTLYTADLAIATNGRPLDAVRFRFGMRQITVEGGHYTLNGRPLWLRGSNLVNEWHWGGRDGAFNASIKTYIVDEARAMNLNCFRTHTCPPPATWLNVADRHGTMIWAELSVLYNYRDFKFTPAEQETFHANALRDATGWVTKLWNHPSVVMWVLSNESRRDIGWESGPYHDHVVGLDPTRPTMRTGCTVGTAENVDIHTCGNVSYRNEGDHNVRCADEARNKDPKRTLTNSEYMNHLGPRDLIFQRLLGDAKHRDAPIVYAELGMEHTEVMRRLQYDGILPYMYAGWTGLRNAMRRGSSPWRAEFPTPMAAALHSAMSPVLASVDLFDRNFVAGESITTPLVLINETPEDVAGRLDIYVTPVHPQLVPDEAALKAAVSHESRDVTFKADTVETTRLTWRVPETEGVYYLAVVLRRPGRKPVVSQREVRAIDPKITQREVQSRRVLLLGGSQVARKWLRESGNEFTSAMAPGKIDADVVLIWDAGRLGDAVRKRTDALLTFARGGGRIVILSQKTWSWTALLDCTLREREASRAFAYPKATHPVLTGIQRPFLMRWNGLPGRISEGYVTGGEALETGRKLLWTEQPPRTVLLATAVGKGEILLCQLMVRRRISRGGKTYDPVADRLMRNLVGRF